MSCLKNPFAVLLGKLPPWIKYVIDNCPFIFSLRTRIFTFRVLNLKRTRASFNVMDRNMEYVPYFDQSMVVFNTLLSFKIRKKNILTELIKVSEIKLKIKFTLRIHIVINNTLKCLNNFRIISNYYYSGKRGRSYQFFFYVRKNVCLL